ncbi:hypothetical protein JCM9279_002936 [Rhodotorula babjevae]
MSAAATTAEQQPAQPPVAPAEERALALFARSALDLFDMWPALRLAISHGWGGDGKEGKTAIAEDVVDLFYSAATSGTSAGASSAGASSSLMEQGIPLPAADDVAATLLYVVGNEFDVDLEDGSEALVARDLVALWRECLGRVLATPAGGDSPEGELAKRFREGAERARAQDRGGARFEARREGGEGESSDEGSEFSGSESDEEMEGIEEEQAPQLVETRPREEPVVDEDGFELVQTKKKGGRR